MIISSMRNINQLSCTILVAVGLLMSGCIKNDLPYPKIQQNILSIAADGQLSAATIDTKALTAEIHLAENVNIKQVSFTDYTYTEGAESSLNLLEGTYNLSSPLKVNLSLYQSYEWTITATQSIERYFTIAGQIGETTIDPVGRRVVLSVPNNLEKESLEVTSIKLGPADVTTLTPAIEPGIYDFSEPVSVKVSYFDIEEDWTIYVDTTNAIVTTTQADAWAQVIWAYGAAPEGADNGFQYRKATSSQWIDVPAENVTHNAGAFYAYIPHLDTMTEYVVRAVSGENIGNEITVTTEFTLDLPNASFDDWWLKDDKIWCPWAQTGESFWDTGNTGAATLGQSNVVPSDNTPKGKGKSAMLETKFVGIAGVGKLAAGSIYSGSFKKVDGTNGILDYGRPWTARPVSLRGYYNYTTAPINYVSEETQHLLGVPDTCSIYVALADWTAPYEIRTNPKNRQLFDVNSPSIIAYGELRSGTSTGGWQEFEIPLQYRATNRRPSYIVISCAASRLGDFFTGGAGAVLYVDDFVLEYDY